MPSFKIAPGCLCRVLSPQPVENFSESLDSCLNLFAKTDTRDRWLIDDGHLFLIGLEAGSLRSACWHDEVLVRAVFPIIVSPTVEETI